MRIAIIPARGGSKRLPGKNIRNFLGRPMLSYPVRAALDSGLFDEVMVSTEDEQVIRVAKDSGAQVPFSRSNQNANDTATLSEVITEVLGQYRDLGRPVAEFCCLLATACLVDAELLKQSQERFRSGGVTTLFSVVRFDYPIQRALRMDGTLITLMNAEHKNARSQDLEPAFHDAGMFYWGMATGFLAEGSLFTKHTGAIELPRTAVQDIDDEEDWRIAELKFRLKTERA
jgi:pseudaminic acid cytidylyltransferase